MSKFNEHTVKVKYCKKCNKTFSYSNEDCKWDEKGSYGSTKYVQCPTCGRIFILNVIEDKYDNLHDYRFYTYLDRK